jgi:hypothetical protein
MTPDGIRQEKSNQPDKLIFEAAQWKIESES